MTRTRTAIVTLMLVVAAVAPFAGTAAAGEIAIDVAQADDGSATVTVTHNGSVLPNATVEVSTENASYAGNGTYTTDENGTVSLPEPEDDVTITVTASDGNASASTTFDLVGANPLSVAVSQASDGSATVSVTDDDGGVANASVEVTADNATYAGEGSHATDENGTVSLPAPEQNVTVTVTATDGDRSASTTADLVAPETDDGEDDEKAFGQRVAAFVHSLLGDGGVDGSAVADFVTENNPGNAPDHAGSDADEDDESDEETDGNETDAAGSGNGPGDDHPGNGNGPGGNNGQGNGNGQAKGHGK